MQWPTTRAFHALRVALFGDEPAPGDYDGQAGAALELERNGGWAPIPASAPAVDIDALESDLRAPGGWLALAGHPSTELADVTYCGDDALFSWRRDSDVAGLIAAERLELDAIDALELEPAPFVWRDCGDVAAPASAPVLPAAPAWPAWLEPAPAVSSLTLELELQALADALADIDAEESRLDALERDALPFNALERAGRVSIETIRHFNRQLAAFDALDKPRG